jgi:DeoR family glycerol-3-phosphate regulon repressor
MNEQIPQRQQEILGLARAQGRVSVDNLALRFNVTPQTIRKDLNELCELQLVSRVHGGAVISSGIENIAYEARRFIPNNASLFINIGTTTEEVARALGQHEDLLVITNNLNVANLLYRHPRIDVIMAGGPVRRLDGAVVGSAAVDFVTQFRVDYAVIGTSAIEEDGSLLDFDVREVRVSRAIIENARKVILVADRLKLQRTAPVRIGHLSDIDVFVTDELASFAVADVCRTHNVQVVEVGRTSGPGDS